jgi:hypothetical protein
MPVFCYGMKMFIECGLLAKDRKHFEMTNFHLFVKTHPLLMVDSYI